MIDNAALLISAGHLLAGTAFAALVIAGYRAINRRSRALGNLVALGILGRAILGLTLFVISYFELPIAQSLQLAGGFWRLASDATLYYDSALRVMEQGLLDTNYHGYPSPLFVQVLAVWMWLVGVSPAVGLLLNICFYIAASVLIVRMFAPVNDWRRDLPCIVAIGAYSFSPIVFIHSTQILKDDFFYFLITVACISVLGLSRLLVYSDRRYRWWAMLGVLALAATLVGLSNIRWYFPVIVWAALACMCLLFIIRGRTTPLPRYLVGSAGVLLLMAVAAASGADPNTVAALGKLDATAKSAGDNLAAMPSAFGTMAQSARTGFLKSAGDTNIVVAVKPRGDTQVGGSGGGSGAPHPPGSGTSPATSGSTGSTPQPDVSQAIPRSAVDHVQVAALGLAVVFVPISLLKATSIIDFDGGRQLLPIADLDTILLDVAILFLLVAVWKRRHRLGDYLPFVVFAILLSGATAVLLGYVVTNYGTLVRMRPMVAVPLWAIAIALSPRVNESRGAKFRADAAVPVSQPNSSR